MVMNDDEERVKRMCGRIVCRKEQEKFKIKLSMMLLLLLEQNDKNCECKRFFGVSVEEEEHWSLVQASGQDIESYRRQTGWCTFFRTNDWTSDRCRIPGQVQTIHSRNLHLRLTSTDRFCCCCQREKKRERV